MKHGGMANGKLSSAVDGLKPSLIPVIQIDGIEELAQTYSKQYQLNLESQTDKKRKKYALKLLQYEREMNLASEGEAHINIENRVDFATFPRNFKYTRSNVSGRGVNLNPDPAYLVGCDCQTCCTETCKCPKNSGGEFAYDASGRVKLDRGTPIYECNMRCSCDKNCRNRVVQRGRTVKVCIFRTKKRGWGLKTLDNIPANHFVTEYVGEIITNEEAEMRGKRYDQTGQTYLFDLDYNEAKSVFTIDAYHIGNVSRFINHSCDPNLTVYGVWIDIMNPDLPHIALFATRDIQPGEELTFDYLMTGGDSTNASPGSSSKETRRKRCHCKSANCRKWLF